MEYKNLGKSDLKVSTISFGCMSLEKDADNNRILNKALDSGINFFDTADLYDKGENEIIVGKAFKGKREKVLISTKVGNQWKSDGSGWVWNSRKDYILEAVELSLKRLGTDYIDLYQLHGGTMNDLIDDTIEAFEILKQQGKIRHYGISSIRPNVIRQYAKKSGIVSVMMQYSLLDRRPEETALDFLEQQKISVLARGSLAKGLLVDKSPVSYLNYSETEVENVQKAMKSIAAKSFSSSYIAIKYVLNHPAVAAAVVGMRTEAQLNQLMQFNSDPLPISEIVLLKKSIKASFYDQHR